MTPVGMIPRRSGTIAVLTVLALVLGTVVVLASAASAAAPEPATPSFGRQIDPLAGYDPQRTCSPDAKPGTLAFADLIRKTYGSTQSIGISRACSTGGTSEHKEGRALDWMRNMRVTAEREQVDALVTWLMRTDQYGNTYAMVRRLGVMYMIWKSRIWRAYDPTRGGGSGWTEYSSCLSRYTSSRYDTMCHRDHLHISMSWPGARAQTSWYTGASQPTACTTTGTAQPPTLPTAPTRFVPLTQARIVNTVTGIGVGVTDCRLVAQHPSVFQVTGRGGVPASGVSAVAVQVRLHKPSQSASLTAFPAGAAQPAGFTVSAPAGSTRTATTVLPVSPDGKIATSLSAGTAEFSLDVLGHYPASGGAPYRVARQERVITHTLQADQTVVVPLGGHAGIPTSGVAGVVLGGHVWAPAAAGGIAAWSAAASAQPPGVSALTFSAGSTRSARLVVPSTGGGQIKLHNRSASPVKLSLDTVGWFGRTGFSYQATRSRLVMDTGTNLGVRGAFTADRTATLPVAGVSAPADVHAVVLQVGAVVPSANTRLTAWANGNPRPAAGAFYPRAGETQAQVVIVRVGQGGRVALHNRSGTVHLRANLLGYYR